MKKILLLILLFSSKFILCQNSDLSLLIDSLPEEKSHFEELKELIPDINYNIEELKTMYIHKDISTHLIFMEEIKFVDISIPDIVGDIPVSNIVRFKPLKDGASGVITIISESHFVQYLLVYSDDIGKAYTRYNVPYTDLRSYISPESLMTKSQMFDYAYRMFISKNKYFDVSTVNKSLRLELNNIYTIDKYYFIDLSLFNKSNIKYDIEQIRFKIEDKKLTKATNFQSVEILPLLELSKEKEFKKKFRNIYVFEKFTFPESKVLSIEISEKQISGRTIILRLDYQDILKADSFIN